MSQNERRIAENKLIVSYLTLRRLIGWLGVTLPVVIYLGNWLIFTHRVGSCLMPSSNVPYSLSGYYYTHMRGLFTGTFSALGVFLVAYNGYDLRDQLTSTAAGLAAIGIAIFPTKRPDNFLTAQGGTCGPRIQVLYNASPDQSWIALGHNISLIVLLSALFVMALLFTKKGSESEQAAKNDQERNRKKRNNSIYRFSAAGIAAGGLGAIVQAFLPASVQARTPWLFWFEFVAIIAFGVAWFVKGEAQKPLAKSGARLARLASRRAKPASERVIKDTP